MKNTIKIISIILILSCFGCDRGGFNVANCRQAVINKYGPDVQSLPEFKYKFLVRTTNNIVWYVECMGSKAEITAETVIFGPK